MARYKVLKSVAHNIGHSFTSLMNYADDDYVMGHILRFARKTGTDTLTIDFVKGEAGPPELLAEPLSEIPVRYTRFFWDMVDRHGSERSCVRAATLTLRYNWRPIDRSIETLPSSKAPTIAMCVSPTSGAKTTPPMFMRGGIRSDWIIPRHRGGSFGASCVQPRWTA